MSDIDSEEDTSTEQGPSERRGLLANMEDSVNNYASEGETDTQLLQDDVELDSEEEQEGAGRRRRQPRSQDESAEERQQRREEDSEDTSCGLVSCLRLCVGRFLHLLPSVGDDEDGDNPEAAEAALRYGAKQIIMLILPVTICMAVVVLFELSVAIKQPPSNTYFIYTPFQEDDASSGGQTFLFALLNALIVVAIVIVMTVVLVCLFKYRCYRAIQVWLMLASGSLLFVFSSLYFVEILMVHNLPIDWFSFAFYIWNFGVMGLFVIHWKGPLRLQQAYLILISALVATRFIKYLPNWTTWLLLAAISIYDLFAVLCPKGPLRVLVETARERNEPIFPSLIYSSTMVWIVGMADNGGGKRSSSGGASGDVPKEKPHKRSKSQGSASSKDSSSGSEPDTDAETDREVAARDMARSQENPDLRHASPEERERDRERRRQQRQQLEGEENEKEEPRGFKLGLGDFIFYSILVGKAAHDSEGDWVVISSCFVAILIGLCVTSLILGTVRRALPALPISIFFGLMFYFSSQYLISPFVSVLATTQVFI